MPTGSTSTPYLDGRTRAYWAFLSEAERACSRHISQERGAEIYEWTRKHEIAVAQAAGDPRAAGLEKAWHEKLRQKYAAHMRLRLIKEGLPRPEAFISASTNPDIRPGCRVKDPELFQPSTKIVMNDRVPRFVNRSPHNRVVEIHLTAVG